VKLNSTNQQFYGTKEINCWNGFIIS
jgi:hypothetical protein